MPRKRIAIKKRMPLFLRRRCPPFLKRILKRSNRTVQLWYLKGSNIECNICAFRATRFANEPWHKFTSCPDCRSTLRLRLLVASLHHLVDYSLERLVTNKTVLHFAPERGLVDLLESVAKQYDTADLLAEGYTSKTVDYELDISSMPEVDDGSYDLLVASDVLEHVPNDRQAVKEIFRVLKPGGFCILTVPQKDNLERTYEDPRIQTPKERERAYGQWDHVRYYGADFPALVESAGFKVTAVDENSFSKTLVARHVLSPPVKNAHRLAPNHRKIFFGYKPA